MRIYFEKNCEKHDKQFWRTISPFMSDKKFRNGGNIILNENGETKTDAAEVSEIFNDFFISTASEIGHNEDIASVPQAIDEYANYSSVMMIKRHYDNVIENFDFHSMDANDVMNILKNINPTKATVWSHTRKTHSNSPQGTFGTTLSHYKYVNQFKVFPWNYEMCRSQPGI